MDGLFSPGRSITRPHAWHLGRPIPAGWFSAGTALRGERSAVSGEGSEGRGNPSAENVDRAVAFFVGTIPEAFYDFFPNFF